MPVIFAAQPPSGTIDGQRHVGNAGNRTGLPLSSDSSSSAGWLHQLGELPQQTPLASGLSGPVERAPGCPHDDIFFVGFGHLRHH